MNTANQDSINVLFGLFKFQEIIKQFNFCLVRSKMITHFFTLISSGDIMGGYL